MAKPPPPDERPSLREMAGQAGLECPRCGCRDFRVLRTIRGDGFIDRVRCCRYCGSRRVTAEKMKGS
jgi:DNA-directed RNA polymerase subunit RPC12/RpoP